MLVKDQQLLGQRQRTIVEHSKQHENQHVISSQIPWVQWNISPDRCLYLWRVALKEKNSELREHLSFSIIVLCFWMEKLHLLYWTVNMSALSTQGDITSIFQGYSNPSFCVKAKKKKNIYIYIYIPII